MIKIRTLARAYAPLRDLLLVDGSLKVYRNLAPEGAKMPFMVWSVTSTDPIDSIDCAGGESYWNLQFDIYSSSEEQCDEVASTAIGFINSFGRFKGYVGTPTVIGEYRITMKAFAITET